MLNASAWGVLPGHHDIRGAWVDAPRRGVDAALAAMRATADAPPPPSTWVIRQDRGLDLPCPAELVTEDGTTSHVAGHVSDPPLGYHRLDLGSHTVRLIVSPGVCPVPARLWGWAVQLYGARSTASWGMGDLADLRTIASWPHAGGVLLVNPLHAAAPTLPQQPSPYAPSSRRWCNPIYLRIDDVPGVSALDAASLASLERAGHALNAQPWIDRDEVWRLKREALSAIWTSGPPLGSFETWVAAQGETLRGFATWAALADAFGGDSRHWPAPYQDHRSTSVDSWAADHEDRIRFHAWLQWLMAQQLQRVAAAGPAIVTDLAVGADAGGADAWLWRDVLADGVTIGAPPDEFNPQGQDWGLPPFDPWRLGAHGYEPFVQTVRAAMATRGGVRIDHVAGLFRAFWVPSGDGPACGAYVRYPWEDLVNILALEAHRAGAFVIGEDLGTVEPWVRTALAAAGVLSYRVLWFEDEPPATWPELALAAVTTHDLPTVSGVWTGADDDARSALGLQVDAEASRRVLDRCAEVVGSACPPADVVVSLYRSLSAAPPRLVVGSLEDALGVDERTNHPGTVDEWPNWRIGLPLPLEEIENDPRVRAAAEALGSGPMRSP